MYGNSSIVSSNDRYSLFFQRNVWIPDGARCCASHLVDRQIKSEEFDKIKPTSIRTQELTAADVDVLLNKSRDLLKNQKRLFNFDNPRDMSDDDYQLLTGLSIHDFNDFVDIISSSNIRHSSNRSIRTCAGLYLCKLRLGLSNRLLTYMFNLPDKRTVSRIINSARQAASSTFVSQNLGFSHITRDDVIDNHTSTFARQLISDGSDSTAIVVIDGTYIYIQVNKSCQQYSWHFFPKFRNRVITNFKEKHSIYIKNGRY